MWLCMCDFRICICVFLLFAELWSALDVFNTWFITYIKLGCVQMNSGNQKLAQRKVLLTYTVRYMAV